VSLLHPSSFIIPPRSSVALTNTVAAQNLKSCHLKAWAKASQRAQAQVTAPLLLLKASQADNMLTHLATRSGRASAARGRTPTATAATSSLKLSRWTDASLSVSHPKRRKQTTCAGFTVRPLSCISARMHEAIKIAAIIEAKFKKL
jgi:hypothetical protein